MAISQPSQLYRSLMGINALNPFDGHDSSSRKQMFASHLGQALVVERSTLRRIQTGVERELAKYTFSIAMPVDAEIIRVIPRYQQTMSQDSIEMNPQSVVIYEDVNTGEIGYIDLVDYCSYHPHFGFQYKPTKNISMVSKGASIPKGTVFLDSPSVTEQGDYKYGVELNVAFMTHPAVSEDGILISRDALNKFKFRTYERRIVEFGNEFYPLNLYGTPDKFKAFPDIGESIHPSGILMALRRYDADLAPVEQNIYDLCEVDHVYDRTVYGAGPGGRIVDIKVHHDAHHPNPPTPMGMEVQAEKYDRARRRFYSEILHEYEELQRKRRENLKITREFHNLVVEAISVIHRDREQKVTMMSGKNPLDDWRIEFVIEYEITPTIGFKLTDCHGGKGVICKVCEPEEMPVDINGNRADIVMDPNATVSRSNLGRLYEQYLNGASRDVVKRIALILGADQVQASVSKGKKKYFEQQFPREKLLEAYEYLVQYYETVSIKMGKWFREGAFKGTPEAHVIQVLNEGIYLYMPPEAEKEVKETIKELEEKFPQTYGCVTYVGNSGNRVTTKEPVRIASLYIMLLEKTADDWSAVSSGMLQHFGVLAPLPKTLKYSKPTRNNAIRAWGESEVRLGVSYVGSQIMTDIVDRSNNVLSHEAIVESILRADQPTNIERAIDRTKVPLGNSRPLQIVKHIGEVAGWRFTYTKS